MPDTYWLLDRGSDGDNIPIDYTSQANPWPTPERGRAATYDCRFVPNPPTDYSTLSEPALTGYQTRYEALRDYSEYVGAVSTTRLLAGDARFEEYELSAAAPVGTYFVAVTPPPSIDVRDFYAFISGVDVTKSAPAARYRIDLEMVYLAPVSAYPSRSDARDALEA